MEKENKSRYYSLLKAQRYYKMRHLRKKRFWLGFFINCKKNTFQ